MSNRKPWSEAHWFPGLTSGMALSTRYGWTALSFFVSMAVVLGRKVFDHLGTYMAMSKDTFDCHRKGEGDNVTGT